MKTYCRACGEGTEYSMREPVLCAYCGQAFSSIKTITPAVAVNTPKRGSFTPPARAARPRVEEPLRQDIYKDGDDDDNSFQEDDGSQEDINEVRKVSNAINSMNTRVPFLNIQTPRRTRTTIKDVQNSSASNDVVRPIEPVEATKKGKGRPKKESAKDILDEFKREAGTLRKK